MSWSAHGKTLEPDDLNCKSQIKIFQFAGDEKSFTQLRIVDGSKIEVFRKDIKEPLVIACKSTLMEAQGKMAATWMARISREGARSFFNEGKQTTPAALTPSELHPKLIFLRNLEKKPVAVAQASFEHVTQIELHTKKWRSKNMHFTVTCPSTPTDGFRAQFSVDGSKQEGFTTKEKITGGHRIGFECKPRKFLANESIGTLKEIK